MPSPKPHRKLVKHFDKVREIHELTFSCYRRLPVLDDQWRREQLSIALNRALDNHGWRLTAFVFMPEHVHLLIYPSEQASRVADLLFAIKRPLGYRVKLRLTEESDPLLRRLTIRQRPGKTAFRFWQEGPGYDRNIRTEKVLHSAIDYVHLNPVHRGLVKRAMDYQWSSARWYASGGIDVSPALPQVWSVPPEWFASGIDFTSH